MKEYLAALMINLSIELPYRSKNLAFINVFRMFLKKNTKIEQIFLKTMN